jgi:hypothetical protein
MYSLTNLFVGPLNSMSQIALALPPPPPPLPASVPPNSLNGETLYERDDACKALVRVLDNSLGNRITPICGNCFGAGKTSLIWKFRDVLNKLTDWDWPEGTKTLRDAIYINVRFNNSLTLHKGVDCQDPEDIDRMLLQRFTSVFSRSLKSDLRPASVQELIFLVNQRCGDQKLLLHLDDVGSYEHYADSKNILYRMWHIGEKFRTNGHYYVLTGRSLHLHTIGKERLSENPTSFQSPSLAELIPLPLLTSISVKAILPIRKKDSHQPCSMKLANQRKRLSIIFIASLVEFQEL